jgi:hypothetical protein
MEILEDINKHYNKHKKNGTIMTQISATFFKRLLIATNRHELKRACLSCLRPPFKAYKKPSKPCLGCRFLLDLPEQPRARASQIPTRQQLEIELDQPQVPLIQFQPPQRFAHNRTI